MILAGEIAFGERLNVVAAVRADGKLCVSHEGSSTARTVGCLCREPWGVRSDRRGHSSGRVVPISGELDLLPAADVVSFGSQLRKGDREAAATAVVPPAVALLKFVELFEEFGQAVGQITSIRAGCPPKVHFL